MTHKSILFRVNHRAHRLYGVYIFLVGLLVIFVNNVNIPVYRHDDKL